MAALDAFSQHGLDTDLGAFASVAEGDLDSVADAVSEMIRQAMSKGATSLRLHVGRDGSELMVAPLHDALDSMIRSVQREIGKPSEDWDRSEKQMAVRLLEDNGAFLLRGAVDDIARIMGVSRITIYNYLNAIDRKAQR